MCSKTILTTISFLLYLNFVVCKEKPLVETTHGQILGKVLRTLIKNLDYFGFMGIPYAAPPVKSLRFLPPQPIDPWDETLKASKEKPACMQFNNDIKKGQPLGHYGTEDCLYLDIFTPGIDQNKRAVIMFIFNDHFLNSYNKSRDYAPDFFIEEDIVVVTISYRLASLGFLSLQDEILPGNSGLKDIVQGLEWVKDNIEHFGGDSKRITLMGLQGGAAGIDLLLYSKAKNLFSGAILQSGTSWTSAYLQEDVKDRSFKLGELLERGSSSGEKLLKELQEIPASDLLTRDLHASPDDYFKDTQKSVVTFGPIVERPNGLITEYPEDSQEKINIPIMIGFNSREGIEPMLQYLIEPRYISFLRKDFPFLLPRRLKFKFDPLKEVFENAIQEIKDFYFTRGEITLKSVPDVVTYMGDVLTNYAVDYTAKVYSERSLKPVYYYHFNYSSILNENKINLLKHSTVAEEKWGAATGDEMCYLFKCPGLVKEYLQLKDNMSEEKIVQRKLIKLWTNFAKFGNPTPDNDEELDGLKWPPYTIKNKEYLNIEQYMEIQRDLLKNRFNFWDQFIEKWERMAIDGVVSESVNKKKDEL